MMQEATAQNRESKRTSNACVHCRQSKIKCSGTEPCTNCQRRRLKCQFSEVGNSVSVSERYLQELQRQAGVTPRSKRVKRSRDDAASRGTSPADTATTTARAADNNSSSSNNNNNKPIGARDIWTSPFSTPSTIVRNAHRNSRNWIWLAPSSPWSFTARLTIMITDKLGLDSPFTHPGFMERDAYTLEWSRSHDPGADLNNLPSIDHAHYLFNTVKFHLGQNYWFLDEDLFMRKLHAFYHGRAAEIAASCRLWYIEFLLVIAYGKAFLMQTTSRSLPAPAGGEYFIRAMSLMPDMATMWKDSLLAIEVLALAGLYLYAADHRESAHVYISQAIRIAQLEGLHTHLPENEISAVTLTRCRRLWWTLYVIERHFSSSLGLPLITHDEDITTPMPLADACSPESAILGLQVKLSQMLRFILSTIYKTEKTQLGRFLDTTCSILQTMAGHAQEIEQTMQLKFNTSVSTMPKGTRHVTLQYHQCVITATKPLLLSILKERLVNLGQADEDWQSFLEATADLINTGIKSATKTIQILSCEEGLLGKDVFLPFDLEFTYSALLYLIIANTLFPDAPDCHANIQEAYGILDEMIGKGNRIAETRKQELLYVAELHLKLAKRVEWQTLDTLTLNTSDKVPEDQQQQQEGGSSQTDAAAVTSRPAQTHSSGNSSSFPIHPSAPNYTSAEGVQPVIVPTTQQQQQHQPQIPYAPELSTFPIVNSMNSSGLLDDIGISSYDFLFLADQLGHQDLALSASESGQSWEHGT